jgi:fructose-1,6-bisphosphatase II / sedoheptulose-1,7-bisphosphatase
MSNLIVLDYNLGMEPVRVTEYAVISAVRLMGGGDERTADHAAVGAIHLALNSMVMDGIIGIGEFSQGDTEKIYTGESVSVEAGPKISVATIPLELWLVVAPTSSQLLSW